MPSPALHPPPDTAASAHWPAERFYWSILEFDGSASRTGTLLPPASPASTFLTRALLEDLPFPSNLSIPADHPHTDNTDPIHAIFLRLDAHRVLACAASRDDLSTLLSANPALTFLSPLSLPPFIAPHITFDSTRLNLLVGPFTPPSIARQLRRRTSIILASFSLLIALIILGLIRRTSAATATAHAFDAAATQLLREFEPDPAITPAVIQKRLANAAEDASHLDSALRIRPMPFDAAASLESLLTSLPQLDFSQSTPSFQITSLSLSAGEAALSVETPAGPHSFLATLSASPWHLDPPRITQRARGGASLSLHLRTPSSPLPPP